MERYTLMSQQNKEEMCTMKKTGTTENDGTDKSKVKMSIMNCSIQTTSLHITATTIYSTSDTYQITATATVNNNGNKEVQLIL